MSSFGILLAPLPGISVPTLMKKKLTFQMNVNYISVQKLLWVENLSLKITFTFC